MKYYVLILFFSLVSKAQNIEDNPYNQSLKDYVINVLATNQNLKFDTIYVLQKNFVTDNLTKKMIYNNKSIYIKIVSAKEILKGKIDFVIEILPITAVENNLSIDVLDLGIEIKKRKKINFIKSTEGIRYDLKYDCNTNNFYIKKNDAF